MEPERQRRPVPVRFTPDELASVTGAAAKHGQSRELWIRQAAVAAAEREHQIVPIGPPPKQPPRRSDYGL